MIVLVASQRQAMAFDRVTDEANRAIMIDGVHGLGDHRCIVSSQIAHQVRKLLIIIVGNQGQRFVVTNKVGFQLLAPGCTALEGQCRIKAIVTAIDPVSQLSATGAFKGCLHERAIFQLNHIPTTGNEDVAEAGI